MRIGLLTTSFPRHEHDIAGAFVLGYARALAERGHTLHVLAPEPAQRSRVPGWPGVEVEYVPYLRPRALQRTFYGAGVPDNLAGDPLAWLGLAPFSLQLARIARARAHGWDALISHWALPCALAASVATARTPALAARERERARKPHVAVFHSADLHLLERLPGRARLAARIARGASALWFVNADQRARFRALLPAASALPESVVCPMGVTLPAAPPLCAAERDALRRRYQLRDFSVLALGRLVPIKGLDLAIRAAAACRCQLLIAGSGPERERLARLARELDCDVRFLGTVVGHEKEELLRAVDAFVLPSRRMPDGRGEGLPTALLEALAHGLPVVAARNPGVDELLGSTPLAAGLVPAHDPAALARALANLRERTHGDLAASARAIAARFSWSRVADRANALIIAA